MFHVQRYAFVYADGQAVEVTAPTLGLAAALLRDYGDPTGIVEVCKSTSKGWSPVSRADGSN